MPASSRASVPCWSCVHPWRTDDHETLGFTLPGDVTSYVVAVHFDAAGEVDGLDMES
jgi:hypothetical protein